MYYWHLIITTALGVILATSLLAIGPILVETVIEFSLRRVLATGDPLAANLRLFTQAPPQTAVFTSLQSNVNTFTNEALNPFISRTIPSGGTRFIHPWFGSTLVSDQRVNIRFYGDNDIALLEKVEFIDGQWPGETNFDENTAVVVIGEAMAAAYNLEVGDHLPLSLRQNDTTPEYWLEIGGIIRPVDVKDPFWFDNLSPLRPQSDARFSAQYSTLIPRAAFFELADSWFSPSDITLEWFVQLAPSQITSADIPMIQAALNDLERNRWMVAESDIHVDTTLHETLEAFVNQSTTVRAPLLALTAAVVLLALYYVMMVSALSLQQILREFAVLRGRGASAGQLFRLQLLEGSFISLVAFISGPGLAWLFVRFVTLSGWVADRGAAEWVLRLPPAAWLAAAVGSAASLMGLLIPLPSQLRHSIISYQHSMSRTTNQPWWQKYYLDLFILVAGLILLWRLQTTGSIVGGTVQQPRVDWLLLLSPLTLLLGAATILLRLFPFVLTVGAKIASYGRGLPAALAMWQTSRHPTHIARLVLLLTLAMAMGLFSTGLNAALDTNETDRAHYASGSDLWIQNSHIDTAVVLSKWSEIDKTAVGWRSEGSLTSRIGNTNPRFDLLAVDPQAFKEVAAFRPDFAQQPMPELLDQLAYQALPDLPPLPGQPAQLGIWILLPADLVEGFRYQIKIRTAAAEHMTLPLRLQTTISDNPEDFSDPEAEVPVVWHYYEASLPQFDTQQYPLHIHSIWVLSSFTNFWPTAPVGFDNLTAVDFSGQVEVVNGFEENQTWLSVTRGFDVGLQEQQPFAGSRHLMLSNTEFRPNRYYGISQTAVQQNNPFPALVSQDFATIAQFQVGDIVSTWIDSVPTNFEIVGMINHFPTLYEEKDAGFLVTLHQPMIAHINNGREVSTISNQLFATTTHRIDEAVLFAAFPQLFTGGTIVEQAEEVQLDIRSDPLALGLRSVTFFGYIITAVLSLAGFGVHFYVSARQNEHIYGILRALGLSADQLYKLLLWEQLVIIFSGLTLGTLLGMLLNWLTLPGLPLDLGGRPPVPPFLLQTDWLAVGQLYLVLTVSFLFILGLIVSVLRRVKLHRILKIGEE